MIRQIMDLDSFSEPTVYKGIEFRSRLEAQQAIRMDLKGWTWIYEPPRFYGRDETYLADFWIDMGPRGDCYLECKGAYPDNLYAVQKRMQIIWDTKPQAYLCLYVAANEGLCAARGDTDREWRWG